MKVHLALAVAVLVGIAVLAFAFFAFMEFTANMLELAERIVEN
jgi:hypothetical protein